MTRIVILFVVYVGCATVGAAAWWFTMYEKGPQLNYYQLVSTRALFTDTDSCKQYKLKIIKIKCIS